MTDPEAAIDAAKGASVVYECLGAPIGAALRRTAAAVALLFAVLLIVPGLVQLLPSPWNIEITRYLPNSAGAAMSAVVRFPNLLSPLAGFLLLTSYAIVTLVIASIVLVRRDA